MITDTVTINYSVDLRLVSDLVDAPVDELEALNPSLLRLTTPPDTSFDLHLPAGGAALFREEVGRFPRASATPGATTRWSGTTRWLPWRGPTTCRLRTLRPPIKWERTTDRWGRGARCPGCTVGDAVAGVAVYHPPGRHPGVRSPTALGFRCPNCGAGTISPGLRVAAGRQAARGRAGHVVRPGASRHQPPRWLTGDRKSVATATCVAGEERPSHARLRTAGRGTSAQRPGTSEAKRRPKRKAGTRALELETAKGVGEKFAESAFASQSCCDSFSCRSYCYNSFRT